MLRLLTLLTCAVLALGACSPGERPTARPAPAPPTPGDPWADLPTGPAPAVPYVRGRRYVAPGGSQVLPGGDRGISAVVPFAGGLLVADATYFEGTNGLALVRDGRREGTWASAAHCAGGGPVASADGRYVAWSTVRCPESDDRSLAAVHRAAADGSGEEVRPTAPGGAQLVQVVGFLGTDVVHNRGFRDGAWRSGFDGGAPTRIPEVDRVVAVAGRAGRLIGQRGDRARLLVDARGTVRWRVARGDLVSFSPDGAAVLAVDGRRISVLRTADGSPRARLGLPAGVDASRLVWESGRGLLALAERDGGVAVVRLGLDGAAERVTAIVPVRAGGTPYVLLGQ